MKKNQYTIPLTASFVFNTRELMHASSTSEEIPNPAPAVRPLKSNAPVTF